MFDEKQIISILKFKNIYFSDTHCRTGYLPEGTVERNNIF